MSILVTGGAGFIGSHLLERLLRESSDQVVCLDDFSGSAGKQHLAALLPNPRLEVVEGNVCDTQVVSDVFERFPVDRVVHLAAKAGVRESRSKAKSYQEVNVGGTTVMLGAAQRANVRRFVFASSSTVYGMDTPAPFEEHGPLGIPASPYGVTKRAAELMVLNYHHLHALPTVILRPFSVYGPRMRNDLAVNIFLEKMEAGESITLFGDGSVGRDYTHVTDICDGLLAAVWSDDLDGEVINLGSGRPVRMDEVIRELERTLGVTATVKRAPGSSADLPLTHASTKRAWDLLGYQPKVRFEEGIQSYATWYKDRRFPRLAKATVPGQAAVGRGNDEPRAQAS